MLCNRALTSALVAEDMMFLRMEEIAWMVPLLGRWGCIRDLQVLAWAHGSSG